MISLLKRLFLENWQRKLISLILAMIIWMVVNRSLTTVKTVSNVSVRIVNLPEGKTVEGLQENGLLNRKIAVTFQGNRSVLEDLAAKDLEVVINAKDQPDEWVAEIDKRNFICLNSALDFYKGVSRVIAPDLILKKSKLISEKIPVLISQPIGEAPKGYQFLDVWPYQLSLRVTGPEETIKKLKQRGLKLTFNLSDIDRSELDSLQKRTDLGHDDEVSYPVPESWKKILISSLSPTPFQIDDPLASQLQIDFTRQELLLLNSPLPVTVFYPPKYSNTVNPETYPLSLSETLMKRNGILQLSFPVSIHGVSRLFLEIVKEHMEIVIVASPKSERGSLDWSVQFLGAQELENRYVSKMLSELSDETREIQPQMRDEYLRNRFRRYMNHLRLYNQKKEKLSLDIQLEASAVSVREKSPSNSEPPL